MILTISLPPGPRNLSQEGVYGPSGGKEVNGIYNTPDGNSLQLAKAPRGQLLLAAPKYSPFPAHPEATGFPVPG